MVQTIEHQGESRKKPSFVMTLVVCGVISLVAAGAGFGASAMFLKVPPPAVSDAPSDKQAASAVASGGESGHGENASKDEEVKTEIAAGDRMTVVPIAPITTNLADSQEAWIRMELALVYDGEPDEMLSEEIHQDILAYAHTMKLYNLEGASGYQHLVQDLEERASLRSKGRVKKILIRTLILE